MKRFWSDRTNKVLVLLAEEGACMAEIYHAVYMTSLLSFKNVHWLAKPRA